MDFIISNNRQIIVSLQYVASVIGTLLNEVTGQGTAYITPAMANDIAFYCSKVSIHGRTRWRPDADLLLSDNHTIGMLTNDLNIPDHVKTFYRQYRRNNVIFAIEHVIDLMLDAYLPPRTWLILSVKRYTADSFVIYNDGDFRIESWAKLQEINGSKIAELYPPDILRE